QVTRHQESLLDLQWLEVPDMALEDVEYVTNNMTFRLRRLLIEHDRCREVCLPVAQQPGGRLHTVCPPGPFSWGQDEWNTSIRPSEDTQHLAMELADTKATLRGVRQELEEKTKQLADTRNQLYQLVLELQEARHNNMELAASAQAACSPLPELDSLREKVNPMERLEMEAMGLRQKEKDIDFYAATSDQVRTGDDYSMDTKGHLQEHWIRYWIDKLFEREEENVQLKSKLHHLQLDRDTYQKCLEELWEENMALKTAQGQSVEESAHLRWELEQLSEAVQCDKAPRDSHVFLLNKPRGATSRARRLEEENQQLRKDKPGLPSSAVEETSGRTGRLTSQAASLVPQIEDLRVQMEREKQTSQVLETLCEELVEEREQLLRDKKTLKAERAQEFKDLKKVLHSLWDSSQTGSKARMKGRKTEQKVLLQTVTDTKRKVTMMEWERRQLCRDLEQVKAQAAQAQELEHMKELHRLQEEIEKLAMEVSALTTAPERVHALEWESQDLLLENQRLQTSLDTLKPEGLERDKQLLEQHRRELSTFCACELSLLRSSLASASANARQRLGLPWEQVRCRDLASQGPDNKELLTDNKELLTDNKELRTDNEKLLTDNEELLTDIEELLTDNEELLTDNEELLTDNEELLTDNEELLTDNEELRTDNEELLTDNEELLTDNEELLTDIEELLIDNEKLLTDNEELLTDKELLTDYKELLTDNKELLTDNEELLTDNEELLTDNEELRTDKEELLTDKEELLTDKEELRTDNEELLTDNEELLTDNEELLTDNEKLLTDNKELQMSLKDMQPVTQKLQTQVNELLTDNKELLTDNKALRTDKEELRTDNEELLTDNKELRTDNKELLTYNEELLTDNKELLTDNEELRTDYKELRTDYKELQIFLKDMQCEDTQREVNHWQGQYEGLKAEQEALYAHTKELHTHTKELLTENQELQTTLKDTQQEVNRWQGQYEELKGEQEELQMHNKKLQTSLNDTQLEMNCWRNQCNGLREELQSRDISLTELDNHCQVRPGLEGS
uniref:Uncharacterized protein n=1 Tax=Myotis lucifugus TaxID=59463 RepID=G1QED0_MYOLU